MDDVEETKQKVTVTVGLIIWIAIVSFSMGMIYTKIIDAEIERESDRLHNQAEIDGLREDWKRRNVDVEKRLDRLESKHIHK